jgi:hypothetical protein
VEERLHARPGWQCRIVRDAPRVRVQVEDRHHGHALPGAGLADDAERLAGPDRERDAVDRLHDPVVGLEVRPQVAHVEERGLVHDGRHASRILGSIHA